MKKYVFTDIDGVLASYTFLFSGKGYIDPEKIKLLNRLKELDVELVISSSWGYDDGNTEKSLKTCGLDLPIVGYTDRFYKDWLCRGNEIKKWLIENCKAKAIDYNYVILDDAEDFLLSQKDYLVEVNGNKGLTEKDIEKAIDILSKNY